MTELVRYDGDAVLIRQGDAVLARVDVLEAGSGRTRLGVETLPGVTFDRGEVAAAKGQTTVPALYRGKDVLTSGDVARLFGVAPRTASKWFDSGRLKGYRLPHSDGVSEGDRRIPWVNVLAFAREIGFPLEDRLARVNAEPGGGAQ